MTVAGHYRFFVVFFFVLFLWMCVFFVVFFCYKYIQGNIFYLTASYAVLKVDIKGKGYTCSGGNSSELFLPPFLKGSTIKGKNLFRMSSHKIFGKEKNIWIRISGVVAGWYRSLLFSGDVPSKKGCFHAYAKDTDSDHPLHPPSYQAPFPAGTLRWINVDSRLIRLDVESTLNRCCFNVVCLSAYQYCWLGTLQSTYIQKQLRLIFFIKAIYEPHQANKNLEHA